MKRLLSLTVDVEEWYHSLWFDSEKIVEKYYEGKFPLGGFVKPLKEILNLFNQYKVTTTFFVLKEIAEKFPEMIRLIYDEGHEVASHGNSHTDNTLDPSLFEIGEREARDCLWKLLGEKPKGFRAPNFKVSSEMIDILENLGYVYDSSLVPSIKIPGWYGGGGPLAPYQPSRRDIRCIEKDRGFYEVPISVFPFVRLPVGGGWFLRNINLAYVQCAVKMLLKRGVPAILYIHPWEVSSDNPRIREIPFHVFRRTGKYVLNSIKILLKNIDARKITIQNIVESF